MREQLWAAKTVRWEFFCVFSGIYSFVEGKKKTVKKMERWRYFQARSFIVWKSAFEFFLALLQFCETTNRFKRDWETWKKMGKTYFALLNLCHEKNSGKKCFFSFFLLFFSFFFYFLVGINILNLKWCSDA